MIVVDANNLLIPLLYFTAGYPKIGIAMLLLG